MRLRGPAAIGAALRRSARLRARHKTLFAIVGGVLGVVPAVLAGTGVTAWLAASDVVPTKHVALTDGYDPRNPLALQISVDGSLPNSPVPLPLPAYELPNGPLGIPATALDAYKKSADILGKEQPRCHIDWALIASIGRIESNHARGGYVDAHGTTLERILGPQLNGSGGFAAIPDTDGGKYDGDPVWDHAVGPMQFIPATWLGYASDGNGDGVADPNNLYDASLATGRYLCSGGLDLANPEQLSASIHRYNNSDTYVNTVILWAEAYRKGVLPTPDSKIPVGAPNAAAAPPPPAVPPPPAPPSAPGSPSVPPSTSPTTLPGTTTPITPTKPTTPTQPTTCLPPTTITVTPTTTATGTPTATPTPPPPTCGATVTVTPTSTTPASGTTTKP
ncbi:lytic transglycosylase domain-containing protein [Amycolatopsis sp. NPDC059027]|uniref:lytic transglycosylase domain-containing protein n=1 Tax=Amycolatopsis sp. NPDC059027 TaxID=3346709 RepID=UPI00366DD846